MRTTDYPTVTVGLNDWLRSAKKPGIYALEADLDDELRAHANVAIRPMANRMVVFLPGAQRTKSQRRIPFFHRWSWQEDLPGSHVIALGDPAIALDEKLRGGWFLHDRHDLVSELSTIVRRIAESLGVPPEGITFHGSSIGGFGALAMAAHLRGASALSEIPQIDVEVWPYVESQRILERLFGEPFSEFRKRFPERIHLLDRLRYANLVPPFTLVTNTSDTTHALHRSFMDDVADLDCEKIGQQRLVVTNLVAGHKPLPQPTVIEYLRATDQERELLSLSAG